MRPFFNGGRTITPRDPENVIPNTNKSAGPVDKAVSAAAAMLRRFGALLTYEKPITDYPGDIVLPVGKVVLKAGIELPKNCTGMRLIPTGATIVSVNGGGWRTVYAMDAFTKSEIATAEFNVTAGICTVQPWGVQD